MGLDVYVGPLTRYLLGDWLTVVQQLARDSGMQVHVVRAGGDPDEHRSAPDVVRDEMRHWRTTVAPDADWPEEVDLPYWTDKPDWDGYGGVVLLAAYDEQPDAPRSSTKGLLRKKEIPDEARSWERSPAYAAAKRHPRRYPSLLGGAEWWLPVSRTEPTFEVERPNGDDVLASTVDQLWSELTTLNERTLRLGPAERATALEEGPPGPGGSVAAVGRFGLAVFLELCEKAVEHRQPLLLDY